jgi:P27 family predicted phage terminase small subunit
LKLVAGVPGHRPLPPGEPKPEVAAPMAPRWLTVEARAEWDRLVPQLLRLKLLTELDRGHLAGMCQWWARYVRAEKMLARQSAVIENRNHVRIVSPNLAIARTAWDQYSHAAAEFGITPAARTRISVTTPPEGKASTREPFKS